MRGTPLRGRRAQALAVLALSTLALVLPASTAAPAAAAPGQAPSPATVEGAWQGAIVLQPAEVELDMSLEVGRQADGKWVATIDLPVQGLRHRPVDGLVVGGRELSFRLHDASGATVFRGKLSDEGKTIRGVVSEGGRPSVFVLERVRQEAAERPAPALHALAASGTELAARFDEDADKVRLILLLSPT